MELNALPLEYRTNYGTAKADLDISSLVNNPEASGKCRAFGLVLRNGASSIVVVERPLSQTARATSLYAN